MSKIKNKHGAIISIIQFFMIIALFHLVFRIGIDNVKPVYLINIGVDFVGMMVGFMLYVCCLVELRKSGSDIKYMIALINVAFLTLFLDGCAWLVDGIPALRNYNILVNTLYYMTSPVEAYLFWMYTMTYLKVRKSLIKQLSVIVSAGAYIAIAIRIINIFTGIYFTVGQDGIYARSLLFPISFIYSFFTVIAALVAVVLERRYLERYQIITFFMYAFLPLIMGFVTMFVYGISVGPAAVMILLLLMYCVLNVSEWREMAAASRDAALAEKLQDDAIPKDFPFMPGRKEFDLYAYLRPAQGVCSDFYDYYMIDDENLAMVVGDVSGEAIEATLFMLLSKKLIKSALSSGSSPEKAMELVNDQLCDGNTSNFFLTVWLGVVNLKTGEGFSVNAGHVHPIIRHAGGDYEFVFYKHSLAAAVMENTKYKLNPFKMEVGDSIFVYTDGFSEATNDKNEFLGKERILKIMNKFPVANPKLAIENALVGIDEYIADTVQSDDLALLYMTYYGK